MSLAEFGEISDQQLAKGNPVPALGGLKSGKAYLKPAEGDKVAEGSETEENVEELTDVDKPAKERQKVSPVDCTAPGKAKQQLYHVINVLGPVPEVDVMYMAKRPQGLLNVGTPSARMAVLRSCALGI
jgi:hypothetical protein